MRFFLNGTFLTSISKLMYYFYYDIFYLYIIVRSIGLFLRLELKENLESYHIVQKNKTLFPKNFYYMLWLMLSW